MIKKGLSSKALTKNATRILLSVISCSLCVPAFAQDYKTDIPRSITTPDKVKSKIGLLEFNDGYPTAATAEKIRDELDYLHGMEAFLNSMRGGIGANNEIRTNGSRAVNFSTTRKVTQQLENPPDPPFGNGVQTGGRGDLCDLVVGDSLNAPPISL